MPEATVTYDKPETLKRLKELAKELGFKISPKKDGSLINGVKIIPADKNVDPSDLEQLFSVKNIDAAKLRKEAWQRNS